MTKKCCLSKKQHREKLLCDLGLHDIEHRVEGDFGYFASQDCYKVRCKYCGKFVKTKTQDLNTVLKAVAPRLGKL